MPECARVMHTPTMRLDVVKEAYCTADLQASCRDTCHIQDLTSSIRQDLRHASVDAFVFGLCLY